MLDILTPHLEGELPSFQTKPQVVSETIPYLNVLEDQQQPLPQQEIASELCIAIIVHPIFQQDSPFETTSDTTASEQVVSEDQTSTLNQTLSVIPSFWT